MAGASIPMTALTWQQLHLTHVAVCKAFERSLMRVQVTLPQAMALRAIQDGPRPMTASRLAEYLNQETQSVTGLIDRMEQQGWVRRVRDLPDRRAIRLELTELGTTKLAATQPIGASMADRLFADLSGDELGDFAALLGKVYLTALEKTSTAPVAVSEPIDLEAWAVARPSSGNGRLAHAHGG